MCKRQQSWQWQWHSHDKRCPFHRPNRQELCERLSGHRIILYGDSLTEQTFVSLASLTGGSNAKQVPKPRACESMRHIECLSLCSGSALVCQRIKFGLAISESPTPPRNCSIAPSTMLPEHETFPPVCIRSFDLVLVSSVAHWVGIDGAQRLEQCLGSSRHSLSAAEAALASQAYIFDLYKRQMIRDATHLRRVIASSTKGGTQVEQRLPRVFFRTSPPGYPTPDLLQPDTPHGEPPVFTAPSRTLEWARSLATRNSSRFNHHLFAQFNAIARHAYRSNGHHILDVEVPMLYRVDGHLDLLHYCLPGPADFYAEALWNYVLPRVSPAGSEVL